ncbi:MAG: ABC transporter ATP-binding protein [Candidatus Bathyarchaeota archaeon]|nr:ABC transporter ATP-binding protein [Candidatus Bathyarchaeum sp.]
MAGLMELCNLWKSFGEVNALQNVNLTISHGKITTLLGPSGSGKTTILRIIAGLDTPTRGTLFYGNTQIAANDQITLREKATLVFQKSVFFDTTVYNNIAYGLKLNNELSKEEINNKVSESLTLVCLEGFEKRRAKKLSGGEQQRVSLARALALDRELLLLDEPTVNLDPKNVSIIEETIQRINREKKTTIVLATHNMFQAEAISEKIALLIDGTVKQVGTNQDIFGKSNKYLTSFARLENVFSGTAKNTKEGTSIIDVNQHLQIEASVSSPGKVTVHVRPEDILVSNNPLKSSARNVFKGTIVGIADLGSIAKLTVDAGKKFSVQITKKSLSEMKLNVGSEVYLTFKASAVQLI